MGWPPVAREEVRVRRQYLVNYHLHMVAGEPALEPGSVVTLDLTPEQEERLIGHSLTLQPPKRTKGGKP